MDSVVINDSGTQDFYPAYCNGTTASWVGHLIFAGILMKEFRPKLFVELGTHWGNSYFSFCQAVAENNLDTRCFAVDSWEGEAQAGVYGEDIYRFVSEYNEAKYSSFSTLLRGFFDDHKERFAENSIDLLHIDGFHSYDAVKHDFETWIDKVRPGGIVLFHDTAERQEGFGVWKFWEEIRKTSDEAFAFTHSSGLGVWRKPGGKALGSSLLRTLFSGDESIIKFIGNVSWRLPESMPVKTVRNETIELFTALQDGAFSDDLKEMRILVGQQCENAEIKFAFAPGETPYCRLDIGREGYVYKISCLELEADGRKVFDWLDEGKIRQSNALLEWREENGKKTAFLFPYTDDPQLYFSADGFSSVKNAQLKIAFSSSTADTGNVVAAKISAIYHELQQCSTWKAERDSLNQVYQDLIREYEALRKNQDAVEAECARALADCQTISDEYSKFRQQSAEAYEALRKNQDAVEAERARALADCQTISDEYSKFRQQAAEQHERLLEEYNAVLENRETILKQYNLAQEEIKKHLAQFENMEKEYRAAYRELLQQKDESEYEKQSVLNNFELLSKMYGALREAAYLREEVIKQQQKKMDCSTQAIRDICAGYDREKQKADEIADKFLKNIDGDVVVNEENKVLSLHVLQSLQVKSLSFNRRTKFIRIWEKIFGRSSKVVKYEYDLLSGTPLFDPEWYGEHYPEAVKDDADPLMHYLEQGWKDGNDPSVLFSTAKYLEKYPEVTGNPLVHFVEYGWNHGFSIEKSVHTTHPIGDMIAASGLFNAEWYLEQYPDVPTSGMDPVWHYLTVGYVEDRYPSPLFDTRSYRKENPDLPQEINPLVHYLTFGCREGRNVVSIPQVERMEYFIARETGLFDEALYRKRNGDIAPSVNALDHFMNYGWREGREPSDLFSVSTYNNFNPDIKFACVPPLQHFILSGLVENRRYKEQIGNLEQFHTRRQLGIVPVLYDGTASELLPSAGKRTTAVHLHLCYVEMAEYFVKYLRMLPDKFDLFVSLPLSDQTEYYETYFRDALANVSNVEVIHTPNRGRDIGPFIVTFGKKLMEYDRVCHIHTKRSPHAPQLEGWLDYIMEHLFGSEEQLKFIFSLLEQNDRIVFPPAFKNLPFDNSGWGRNFQFMKEAAEKYPDLKTKWMPQFIDFVHGSMFWGRGSALTGFLDLPLTYDDFPEEPVDSDCTLAHVLERLTLLQTASNGGNADMLFLKEDLDDYVKYQLMQEMREKYAPLFGGNAETERKLILVSHDSDRSGAPILALNIARTLKDMGYKLFIFLLKKGELCGEFESCGTVQLLELEDQEKLETYLTVLKKAGFKNVLLNTLLSGSLAPIFREKGIIPITLVHEMGYSVENYKWENHALQALTGSEKIVMPSSVVAESWKKINLEVPADRLVINPQGDYWKKKDRNVWDKEEARKYVCDALHLPSDSRIVLAAALVEPRKGVDAFVKTAAKFSGKKDKVFFVWVGATPERMGDIAGLTERLDQLDNCIFTSFKKDLDRYIAGADIFFLPSVADPFPAVSLLATSQGTPIVLCDGYTGSSDFCRDFAGGVVNEYSADAFAAEIRRLITDRELYQQVSHEALKFSENFHSLRQYLIEVLSLFPDGLKKVSCIVPNYQYEKYLPERLSSVLQQDYPIYDIVFLDDCSSDNSLQVAGEILQKSNIDYKIIPNKENSGSVFRQWFKGIEAAGGDFIWIAEADDACAPEFLRMTVPAFADDRVNLSYAQSCLVDADGIVYNSNYKTHTDSISATKWTQGYSAPFSRELNDGLALKNTIPNASAIVIRKSAVDQIDKDNLFKYKVAGDWVFYLELLKGGRVAFTPEVLNFYRRHTASVVNKNMERNCQEIEQIHRFILENFAVNNHTVLEMKKEFENFYYGFKPSFQRSLDYESYLKKAEKDELLMFITDDVNDTPLADPEFLRKYTGTREVWFIYAGGDNLSAEMLENLPDNVVFRRLQDVFAGERPEAARIIAAAELKTEEAAEEAEKLKYFLEDSDVAFICDMSGYFAFNKQVDMENDKLFDRLEKALDSGENKAGKRLYFFRHVNGEC